jgi:hypothetical protein
MTVKAKRAALLGFDCAIPKRLEALVAEGALPNFKKFMETGSYMTEGYNLPTVTPAPMVLKTITTTLKAEASNISRPYRHSVPKS